MKYLFFNNTPAHVHLFRNAIQSLSERGHDVSILARRDGCSIDLLEYFELPYEAYGTRATTKLPLLWELPAHYANIYRQTRRYDPDVIFGVGTYAAHAGALTRTPSVAVLDSESSLDAYVTRPFVSAFLTPQAFRGDLGDRHYRFRGVTETAYLHPDVFEPDPTVRSALGVDDRSKLVIVRFNGLNGHHDVGVRGFSPEQKRRLLRTLSSAASVFVSDERGNLDLSTLPAEPFDLHPARIHDALAAADLLVTDTQTMATESALVGTPTIRSNSFVGTGDMGNFQELGEYELVENLQAFEDVLDRSLEILEDDSTGAQWIDRRDGYLRSATNLTDLLVDVAEGLVDRGAIPSTIAGHPDVSPSAKMEG